MQRQEKLEEKATSKPESIYDLMGHSAFVRYLDQQMQQVARTNFTVIIQGDTGREKNSSLAYSIARVIGLISLL